MTAATLRYPCAPRRLPLPPTAANASPIPASKPCESPNANLRAMKDYADEYEFDSETEWSASCLASDAPYFLSAVRLLTSNLQEQCYGPPTLPGRVFRALASIENQWAENLPGSEGAAVALRAAIIVADMVRGFIDGVLVCADLDARVSGILGKPVRRFA